MEKFQSDFTEDEEPNNICCICRSPFYAWFHGQGMVCTKPECREKVKDAFKKLKERMDINE